MIFHRQRGEERTRIAVEARMRIGEFECGAMLLNASSHGVLAAIAEPPVRGTRVRLVVSKMELVGSGALARQGLLRHRIARSD